MEFSADIEEIMKEEKESVKPNSPPANPENICLIGRRLSAARLKKGRTIESVNQETRISKSFIVAMEEDRFSDIPGGSYLRSFLKGYCEYLDLDFQEIWGQLCAQNFPGVSSVPGSQEDTSSPTQSSSKTFPPYPAPAGLDLNSKKVALGLLILFAAIFAIFMPRIFSKPKKREQPLETQAPIVLKPFLPSASEESLVITFKRAVFLRVAVDGRRHFSGKVLAGTRQIWTAHKEIALWTMDPASFDLALNGVPFKLAHPDKKGNYYISAGKNSGQVIFNTTQRAKNPSVKRKYKAKISLPPSTSGVFAPKRREDKSLNLE
jgi:hypothetical protein